MRPIACEHDERKLVPITATDTAITRALADARALRDAAWRMFSPRTRRVAPPGRRDS
jgi:hypothetical protein